VETHSLSLQTPSADMVATNLAFTRITAVSGTKVIRRHFLLEFTNSNALPDEGGTLIVILCKPGASHCP